MLRLKLPLEIDRNPFFHCPLSGPGLTRVAVRPLSALCPLASLPTPLRLQARGLPEGFCAAEGARRAFLGPGGGGGGRQTKCASEGDALFHARFPPTPSSLAPVSYTAARRGSLRHRLNPPPPQAPRQMEGSTCQLPVGK